MLAVMALMTMVGCGAPEHIRNELRAPAYPLITIDPYTSAWSGADNLYDRQIMHWTEKDFPFVYSRTDLSVETKQSGGFTMKKESINNI